MNKKLIIFTVCGFIVGGLFFMLINAMLFRTALKQTDMEKEQWGGDPCIGNGLFFGFGWVPKGALIIEKKGTTCTYEIVKSSGYRWLSLSKRVVTGSSVNSCLKQGFCTEK